MTRALLAAALLAILAHPIFAQAPLSDENGTTFPVSGATIYYHAIGTASGVTLIAVNGGPGFDHAYLHASGVWNDLARNRRVVFYDQRGTGRSPVEKDAAMDLASQVEDLEALRIQINADRIDLLGHSWGGYLVMAYAARHPEHIAHLIIVDSAAPKWDDTIFLFDQVFPDITSAQLRVRAQGGANAVSESTRLYLSMLFYSPEKREAFLSHASEYQYSVEVNRALNRDVERFDLNPALRSFTFPTLVMTGRFDMNVAPLIASKIHDAIPGSKFLIFERSGHLPYVEEPDAFAKAVEEFLGSSR